MSDLYAMDFDAREGSAHFEKRKDPAFFHAQTEQRFNAENGSLPDDVEREIQALERSDLVVVHFPLWWFGMPAMLKGWMDRVFAYGRMYRSELRYDRGVCVGKRVILCVTTGASEDSCAYNGREGDTRLLLWPIQFPFRYLGFNVLEPEVFHGVGGVAFMETAEDGLSTLDAYTAQWRQTLATLDSRDSVPFNEDAEFDDSKRLVPGAPSHSPFIRQKPDW